ncbi:Eco57I restriction-modification methylase domain-containing protein, partial [Thermodesulfovibrio sp.]|uniref:Eco57I restriction-modification methylase domain-containing protein n=1 Tax=Thermodesulfovibrio sp. TaxID=2067987 RepID=UPI003C7A1CC3
MSSDILREALEKLVHNFSLKTLKDDVLYLKFKKLDPQFYEKELYHFEDEKFSDIREILTVRLRDNNTLKAFGVKVEYELSDRSSKKRQFELAKKILRTTDNIGVDAGLFTFYDLEGNFRFSLVHKIYEPGKTAFSYYKRYTYFVERGRPYRTFLKALYEGDFSQLKTLISAFSTLPLTKEFYTEIQNWYAWALKNVWFPGGVSEENLIRLLTRLIFVWFLKEKRLIPEEIFEESFLTKIVKDFGEVDNYYNAVLQNLFFATLNRYPEEREFAKDGTFLENRTHYGVKTLYRYKNKLLISEDEFIKLFSKVPFINGGLFECLDEDSNYIDGFSRREDKRAKIPDFLFFSSEREVDLSDFYGEKKKAKVRGLINILKDYNFTADESSPIDVEVSLDPELLGHIFENLLACYNPETQTTARKATGSYYTPKEIVDFMVEEALLEYFKTKTAIDEEKLKKILSYEEREVGLTPFEKDNLIKAIDSLKVIDPAVGSGAFPMGVVHKLVHVLSKIDPDNKLWYELQFNKALLEVEKVLKIDNKEERENLLKEVNEIFDESINYPDYARKLYIIENSIYGVDIQPIAIQICKLRFFLSLLIDQKVDFNKPNFGIRPLPHLETKFVSADTLISLERPKQLALIPQEIEKPKEDLKTLHKKFFRIKNRKEKKRIENKAKEIREEIKSLLIKSGWPETSVQKIVEIDIFSQMAKADWFDSEWMFGVEDGFDIVIGNPPYVRQERIKELKPILQQQGYKVFASTADIYVYFYEKGYNLLLPQGILCFISSNKWMRAKYGEKLRKLLKENTKVLTLVDFSGYPVFEQTVDTNIILFQKAKPDDNHKVKFVNVGKVDGDVIEYISKNQNTIPQQKLSENAWTLADEKVLAL